MYKIIVLFIILVPFRLYAVDCDGDWRKKVTKKNFHEYEKCMTEAEQKEGKLFTTDMNEISSIEFVVAYPIELILFTCWSKSAKSFTN